MYFRAHNLQHVGSYVNAAQLWGSLKAWRGKDPNEKPLGTRRQTQCKLIKTIENDQTVYICRYYNTDVATFWPSGDITIRVYDSVSTRQVINRVLSSDLGVANVPHLGPVLQIATCDRPRYRWAGIAIAIDTYRNEITVRPEYSAELSTQWTPIDPGTHSYRKVNRRRSRAALQAANYPAFRSWALAYAALSDRLDHVHSAPSWQRRCNRVRHHIRLREYLTGGPEAWVELMDQTHSVPQLLDDMRRAIYRETDVCDQVSQSVFYSLSEAYKAGMHNYRN